MTTMNDVFTDTVLSLIKMTKEQVLEAANVLAPIYQGAKDIHPKVIDESIRIHFETPPMDEPNKISFPEFVLDCICEVIMPDPIPLTKAEIAALESKEEHRKAQAEGRIKSYHFKREEIPVRFTNEREESQTVEIVGG